MTDKIRVLIADDHTIVRSGIRLLLDAETDIVTVGEALDGEHTLRLAEALRPDVILMDIAMPGINGLEATRLIKERFPETQILILSMHRTDEYIFEVIKSGASGYVLKSEDTNQLIEAIRAVARGEVFLHPHMTQILLQDYLRLTKEKDDPTVPKLSPREMEILQLLANGYTNKEIAERLVVSPSTIHTHRTNLMQKLNLDSRHKLVRYARDHGLISFD